MTDDICPVCNKPTGTITDKIVESQRYHLQCFNCNRCNKYLQDKFTVDPHNGKLICKECYSITQNKVEGHPSGYKIQRPKLEVQGQHCSYCGKIVYKAEAIKALGKHWHKLCFKCNVCGQHLTVLDAESHDNKPICKKCTNEILGVIYNSLSEIPEAPVIDTSKPIPLSQLKFTDRELLSKSGVDITKLESYLSDADFHATFKCTRAEFFKHPKWKQEQLKKSARLF
ncbi:cysteine and glycine-rich protein 2-like [Zophobas morio]|uniref:cysteine and glycine-rich protein 2-like n=1 Tax=Zophobas morio TaxID=2755281 RepID=UPI0030830B81